MAARTPMPSPWSLGKTGTLTQTFAKSGTVILGCHQSGHYDSGMKTTIIAT